MRIELDDSRVAWAEEIAAGRARVPRTGSKGVRTGAEGYRTHLIGSMAEIAASAYYGADYEPVVGGRDDGVDFRLGEWTVNVKATPTFARENGEPIHLFALPGEMRNADVMMLCCVDAEDGLVELCGWSRTSAFGGVEWRENYSARLGRWIRCKALPETALNRPRQTETVRPEPVLYDPFPECPDDPEEMWEWLMEKIEIGEIVET